MSNLLSININYVVNGFTIEVAYTEEDEIYCLKFIAKDWHGVMELLKDHIEDTVAQSQECATVHSLEAERTARTLEEIDFHD